MERVVLSLCESIDTPRALSTWLCFKYSQEELLKLPPVDFADNDTSRVFFDYFVSEYLSKYKGLKTSIDPRSVALSRWKAAEQTCLATNKRFREHSLRPFSGRAEGILHRSQRKIASVLGPLELHKVLSDCKWGPGATFDLKREDATLDKKISNPVSVTSSALPYFKAVLEADPHWAACFLGVIPEGRYSMLPNNFNVVRGSRFLTVAKSAKTDRCIGAEPTGNGFLQQGVHSYMRRRLKRFGVDLDDQSRNQEEARRAYFDGLSTLDLSAASDSISLEVVYHLLPIDWALLLDRLRSTETFVDREWVRTEKFASMGNAFCFELETLIFWALSCSVEESLGIVDRRVTVYGDDIIVRREAAQATIEILELCGFTINAKKSFIDGNFFESCGKHFHRGHEVTPVYQKEVLSHPSELIRAHNRLVRLESRMLHRKVSFGGACRVVTNSWPLRPFPRIPFGVSEDGGFLRPIEEFKSLYDRNHGFKCHVFDYRPGFAPAREDALLAYKLRRPRYLNPDNKGFSTVTTKGVWRSKVRHIPESALGGADLPEPKYLG